MKSPLRAERERRGWTLEYVAEKVGVSAVQVSRIEIFGVKATQTPMELVRVFEGTVSLEAICDPFKYADPVPDEKSKPDEAA